MPFYCVDASCNRGASRLGEARRGQTRSGRGFALHKAKARLIGTRNYVILLLKSSRPQGYGNCRKRKKYDETKLEAGLNTSLKLQCRKTIEIRTKQSAQASRQGSRASRLLKLKQNNMTKKGPFFASTEENYRDSPKLLGFREACFGSFFFRPSPSRLSPGRNTVFVSLNELCNVLYVPALGSQKRAWTSTQSNKSKLGYKEACLGV